MDPVAAAAGGEVGPASVVPEAVPRKTYPSPGKYGGHKWAVKINALLDRADPAPKDSMWAKPAETVMVGECAMATGEAWGLGSDSEELPIHPGYLLLCAVVAYGAIVGIGWWLKTKNAPAAAAPTEQRRAALAELE